MAIVMVSDAGTDSVEQYDQIIKQLDEAGHGNPQGRLSHTAALKDNGSYFVVDVWESAEDLERFAQVLVPLIEAVGGAAPDLKISPLHSMINGH
jgi:heme-degrading monooxygenase HmoA